MHLRDRRRRQRLLGELGEHGLERPAQVGLHHGPHVDEALRRYLIAQLLELVDELVGEQALERGDDLAQLHVGGAERLELTAQPAGDPGA